MYLLSRILLAVVAGCSLLLARQATRHQVATQAPKAPALVARLRAEQRAAKRPAIAAWVPWHPAAHTVQGAPGGFGTRWSGVAAYLRSSQF